MKINSAAGKIFELCGAPNVSKTVLKTGFLYQNALIIQKNSPAAGCTDLYTPDQPCIHLTLYTPDFFK